MATDNCSVQMPNHHSFVNISGARIGRLTVIKFAGRNKSRNTMWECLCDCGKTKIFSQSNLKRNTLSCGCLRNNLTSIRNTTHGHTKKNINTPTYKTWLSMRRRCYQPTSSSYQDYGAKGIIICERWQEFEGFLADMGERPSPKHSIDRINNDKGYFPDNCQWATSTEQARNKRNNRKIAYQGKFLCISEWSFITKIPTSTIWNRKRLGWCDECTLMIYPSYGNNHTCTH